MKALHGLPRFLECTNYHQCIFKWTIETATAALVAATRELLKRWPSRRKCRAGIGVLIKRRLPFYFIFHNIEPRIAAYERSDFQDYYFPPFETQIGRKKNPLASSRRAAIFRHPFRDYQLSCGKLSQAGFLFFVQFAFWWVEKNLRSLAFHMQQSSVQYGEKKIARDGLSELQSQQCIAGNWVTFSVVRGWPLHTLP